MTAREKLIARIRSGSKNIRLEEVDKLLILLGFDVRSTTHTYLYSRDQYRITFNRHSKMVHSRAVKELNILLDEILDE
jgi:hypothetical protein